MFVYYVHKMFEHLTVDYKNLIIYPIPPAQFFFFFVVRHTADTAHHNTLDTRTKRAGGVEGAIKPKEA